MGYDIEGPMSYKEKMRAEEMTNYKILEAESANLLEKAVEQYLFEGWALHGGLILDSVDSPPVVFYQVVTR